MGNAIAARVLGDDYQGMVFWKYVNRMIVKNSEIEFIGYEYSDVKSFDDIVVGYKNELRFHEGSIKTDYIQVKFHMRQSDEFTIDNLISPEFINATANSIMHNIAIAYKKMGDKFKECRFIIYSPWNIKSDDPLNNLISNVDSSFEVNRLFDGTTSKSAMGKIRKKFCDKLNITQTDLYVILNQICIYHGRERIDELREILNRGFLYNGLKQCPESKDAYPYIDIVRSWNKVGIHLFNRESILAQCEKEGLVDHSVCETRVAIRSFKRYTDGIEERTSALLDLLNFFDGRFLIEEFNWNDIYKNIDTFVRDQMKKEVMYKLELETHLSIAFTAGRILNTKTGIKSIPIQKTVDGLCEWEITTRVDTEYFMLEEKVKQVSSTGEDSVFIISITNDINEDVEDYLQKNQYSINTIYHLAIPNIGNNSIVNGYHAWILANQVNSIIGKRDKITKRGTLRIFLSGPNALMFNIGKLSMSYGKIQLYEYDFNNKKTGTYYPTITFPQEGEN